MRIAISTAVWICYSIYLLNAVCCYFLFGRNAQSNILLTFPTNHIVMTVIRFLYSCVIFMTYVIVVYPIRRIFLAWMNCTDQSTRRGKIGHVCTGIVIVSITVGCSIAIPDIV